MESTFTAKASENLRAAEMLLDAEMYNASANRAYYAALHAAVAALHRNGVKFDKIDHEKVQAKFSGELIRRRKVYPSRFRSYLLDLQAVRNVADYSSETLSQKSGQRQLKRAREYVGILQQETGNVQ